MKHQDKGFSIVDFLIIVAIVLIMVGMIGPRLARTSGGAKVSSSPTTTTVRPAR
jgi:Tfp pilus assembly protein FimT